MSATSSATAVRTYQVDKSHSEVIFQVRHLITRVRGRFSDFGGTIEFDRGEPCELEGRVCHSGGEHRHERAEP